MRISPGGGLLARRALIRKALDARPKRQSPLAASPTLVREMPPAQLAQDTQSVTKLLYDRLTDDDIADVTRRASSAPELADLPAVAGEANARRWLILNYGIWLQVPSVISRTGLPPDQPPEDVHAMVRGPMAAAGGLGEADMVVDSLRSSGAELLAAEEALDFGCSSGRVVRVLAAAFPEVRWRGCDPNEAAIKWADGHLEGIDFFVNPQYPPLAIAEGELGFVYAISIWSHFAPELGLRWFDEMHRLIRPNGHLVLTTHGMQSVSVHFENGLRSPEQCREIVDALYRRGIWYAAEFGEAGDAGVVNPEWGTTFLTTEWLLTKLCPRWRVLEFAPGRNQRNQDLYVLQRV